MSASTSKTSVSILRSDKLGALGARLKRGAEEVRKRGNRVLENVKDAAYERSGAAEVRVLTPYGWANHNLTFRQLFEGSQADVDDLVGKVKWLVDEVIKRTEAPQAPDSFLEKAMADLDEYPGVLARCAVSRYLAPTRSLNHINAFLEKEPATARQLVDTEWRETVKSFTKELDELRVKYLVSYTGSLAGNHFLTHP
jgi:hypothetical protein